MALQPESAPATLSASPWDDTAIWKSFFQFQSVLTAELQVLQERLSIYGPGPVAAHSHFDAVSAYEIVQETLKDLTPDPTSKEDTTQSTPSPSTEETAQSTPQAEFAQAGQAQCKPRRRISKRSKNSMGSSRSSNDSDEIQLVQPQADPETNSSNGIDVKGIDVYTRASIRASQECARMHSLSEKLREKLDRQKMATRAGKELLGERTKRDGEQYSLLDIVDHTAFSALVATMILFNSVIIAIEVEWLAYSTDPPAWIDVLSYVCAAFFVLELVVRMAAEKRLFFTDQRGAFWWNLFDTLLVLQSISELIVLSSVGSSAAAISSMASMKLLKLARIFRVFRVFRFFRQLTKLAVMIIEAFRDLFWAVVMIVFVVYIFAVVLTMRGTDWLKLQVDTGNPDWFHLLSNSTAPTVVAVHGSYGSLAKTLYTLMQVALGGVSWGEVCDPLISADPLAVVLLLLYIMFILLAVLNVITGTFVDEACRSAEKQRDLKVQEEKNRKMESMQEFQAFFESIDGDGSGEVGHEELQEMLADETLSAYFRTLGFDIDDVGDFIRLLDADGSGSVSIEEFLDGCMRFRGPAQCVDVQHILAEVRVLKHLMAEQYGIQIDKPS